MKLLLFGANGQVGWELQRSLSPLGQLIATDRNSRGGLCGDLSNRDGIAETIRAIQPDVIINAAAHTAVDLAEKERDLAFLINADAVEVMASEAKRARSWLVHFSTDYVFDGSGSRAWREDDRPSPINVYGASKLEGENRITSSGCNHLIFRTSWVHAARGRNFIKTILRLAQEKDSLRIIHDQIGAPTSAELIADTTALAVHQLLRLRASEENLSSGIYHLTASGETSWFEYARLIVEFATELGLRLRVSPSSIEPIPSAAYATPARRPLNSRLNTEHIQKTFGIQLPLWQSGVRRTLAELIQDQKI